MPGTWGAMPVRRSRSRLVSTARAQWIATLTTHSGGAGGGGGSAVVLHHLLLILHGAPKVGVV